MGIGEENFVLFFTFASTYIKIIYYEWNLGMKLKPGTIFKTTWIILALLVVLSMLVFTIAPLL